MTKWKIALLATQWLLLSAQTTPEPFFRPRQLTPEYIEVLRSTNILPPVEFDHEYKGVLKVIRGTQDELRNSCPGTFRPGNYAIGCAVRYQASCIIYLATDSFLQS